MMTYMIDNDKKRGEKRKKKGFKKEE